MGLSIAQNIFPKQIHSHICAVWGVAMHIWEWICLGSRGGWGRLWKGSYKNQCAVNLPH